MTPFLVSLILGVMSGIICFFVEKMDTIPIHIDHHHEPVLAALTGGTAAFFTCLILITITKLTM